VSDLPRSVLIAALLLASAFVIRGTFGTDRYDLVPAGNGSAYRVDRLTGAVHFCTPVVCAALPLAKPSVGPGRQGGQAPVPPAPPQRPPPTGTSFETF
jgi:hypothetical protein